jgi:hypothetical protein
MWQISSGDRAEWNSQISFSMIHGWSAFWRARLDNVLEDIGTKTLRYLYDFGDGWEHTIKIERLLEPEPGVLYPRLIDVTVGAHSEAFSGGAYSR